MTQMDITASHASMYDIATIRGINFDTELDENDAIVAELRNSDRHHERFARTTNDKILLSYMDIDSDDFFVLNSTIHAHSRTPV